MAISTYAELQDAVTVWLNKPDVEQSVTSLISLTEADLNRRLRHWKMTKRSVAEIDSQYSTMPSDYLETTRPTGCWKRHRMCISTLRCCTQRRS